MQTMTGIGAESGSTAIDQLIVDANQLVLGSEFDFDAPAIFLPDNPHARAEQYPQPVFGGTRVDVSGWLGGRLGWAAALDDPFHKRFRLANRQASADDLACQTALIAVRRQR